MSHTSQGQPIQTEGEKAKEALEKALSCASSGIPTYRDGLAETIVQSIVNEAVSATLTALGDRMKEPSTPSAVPLLDCLVSESPTRREYFAAHAPETIPAWFKPALPADIAATNPINTLPPEHHDTIHQWIAKKCLTELPEQLTAFEEAWYDYENACNEWLKTPRYERERYFQWRAFYADQMLATLHPQPAPDATSSLTPHASSPSTHE